MRHLFTVAGLNAVSATLARRPLLAFDFDGTLAPIVPRPSDARVSVAVSRLLSLLAQRRPVAIVTGRRIDDVRQRLGFEPAYIVGNHGSEGLPDGAADQSALMESARRHVAANAERLGAAGVTVEDKGRSLALHYRLAPDPAEAMQSIEALTARLDADLRCFGGKMVVNIVPAEAPDKGEAVRRLIAHSGCDCALFLGDDVNDESVFAVATEHWLTVRIGRDDPTSRAQYFLDSSAEVAYLLRRMVDLLAPSVDA